MGVDLSQGGGDIVEEVHVMVGDPRHQHGVFEVRVLQAVGEVVQVLRIAHCVVATLVQVVGDGRGDGVGRRGEARAVGLARWKGLCFVDGDVEHLEELEVEVAHALGVDDETVGELVVVAQNLELTEEMQRFRRRLQLQRPTPSSGPLPHGVLVFV